MTIEAVHVRDLPQVLQDQIGLRNLIVFDGVCVLCSAHFRFVVKQDRAQTFHFATAQSELGQALYLALNLPTDDFQTNLVILNGVIHQDMDAVAAALRGLAGVWAVFSVVRFLPKGIKRRLYAIVARNRYRFFGQAQTCLMPTEETRIRFVSGGF